AGSVAPATSGCHDGEGATGGSSARAYHQQLTLGSERQRATPGRARFLADDTSSNWTISIPTYTCTVRASPDYCGCTRWTPERCQEKSGYGRNRDPPAKNEMIVYPDAR